MFRVLGVIGSLFALRRSRFLIAGLVALIFAWGSYSAAPASATALNPGDSLTTFDTTTLLAPIGIPFSSPILQTSGTLTPPLTGTVLSAAVPFMGGLLFEYEIIITTEDNGIKHIALNPADAPWLGVNVTNFGYIPFLGLSVPSRAERSLAVDGAGIDVTFSPSIAPPPKSSVVFWFLTDAPSSKLDAIGIQDGQQGIAEAFMPNAVPEPSKVVGMLGLAIMIGLGAVWQMRRKVLA